MTNQDTSIGGLWVRDLGGAPAGPLVVGLHGRGSWPDRLFGALPQVANARHVVPRGIFTFGEGFAWYVGRPAPAEELAASVEAVTRMLEALWAEGHAPSKTLLWGFSQGAMLALQLGLALPTALAGVVAIAPVLHPSASENPSMMARAQGRRFLLLHGERDQLIPPERGADAKRRLESAGAACTWILYPGEHELTPRTIGEVEAFASSVLTP